MKTSRCLSRCTGHQSSLQTLYTAPKPSRTCRRYVHDTTSNSASSFTDKFRKKIWGDKPPIPQDPYTARPQSEREPLEEPDLESQLPEDDLSYMPETDARSMLKVGTRGNFRQRHWNSSHQVNIYKTVPPIKSPNLIPSCTRQAVIEAYTKHLVDNKQSEGSGNESTTATFTQALDPDVKVKIEKTEDGQFRFYYASEAVMNNTANCMHDRKTYKGLGDIWLQLPLFNHELKFRVMKRIRELTGLIIPDASVSHMNTAKDVLHYLIANPRRLKQQPPALAHRLLHPQDKEKDKVLPTNVMVHRYRIRPTDRERARGNTEAIAVIEAGRYRHPGDDHKTVFFRRSKALGLGWHGIETVPDAKRSWDLWDKEVMRLRQFEMSKASNRIEDDTGLTEAHSTVIDVEPISVEKTPSEEVQQKT